MTKEEYRDNIIHALRMEFEVPQWIEFYNKYLSDVGRTERSIVEMENFNDWMESYSHFEIAKMVHNGEFCPCDEYFYADAFRNLYSFSCSDDLDGVHIFLEDLAKWMVDNNETFGEDVFGKLLGEYVSSNEPLNCEFVVTESDNGSLTVGKIYKVVDGQFLDDLNELFPLYDKRLKTFEELSVYLSESRASKVSKPYFGGNNKILKIVR